MPEQRDTAVELMRQKKFSEALPLFVRLMETSPNDWSLYYMAGQCSRFSNRLPESVRYLDKAASLNPDEPQVFLALGIARQLTNNFGLAIEALEQAIRLDPHLVSAYNSIGLTYRKMGDYREALEWYSRASKMVVSIASEIANEKGKCFREETINGKKEVLILPHLFDKTHEILRSDETYATLQNNIGVCLIELGQIDAAREQFKESIEFIPEGCEYPEPHMNLESIVSKKVANPPQHDTYSPPPVVSDRLDAAITNKTSWGQTIAATIVCIVVFFLMLYIASPIIESLLNLFSRWFVPERFGGGSEANPGILNLAFRVIVASGLSAYVAFATSFKIFSTAHAKTVAIVFGLVIAAWAAFFVYAGLTAGVVATPLLQVTLVAIPALLVAYGNGWERGL